MGLDQFFGENSNDWGNVMAAWTLLTLPVMVFCTSSGGRLSPEPAAGTVKG